MVGPGESQPTPESATERDGSIGGKPPSAEPRALRLLAAVQEAQQGLPAPAALAWERAGFRAAFLNPEPGQRIRAFLSGVRAED
jgi:hypothetical protein